MSAVGSGLRRAFPLLLLGWWVGAPALPEASGQSPVRVEEVLQAAKRRQEQARSARFSWTAQVTDTRGSRSLPQGHLNPEGKIIPPKDATYDMTLSLSFDGERIRFASDNYTWSEAKQMMVPCPYVSVFNGKDVSKTLRTPASPRVEWPQGEVQRETRHGETKVWSLAPVLMTFRPLTQAMSMYSLPEMSATGRTAQIGGRTCQELRLQRPGGGGSYSAWVDPGRDFLIARHSYEFRGKTLVRLDVRYRQQPGAGWVPEEWNEVYMDDEGKLRTSVKSKLLEATINPELPPEEFEVTFPPGTLVLDFVEHREYLVRADGSERKILEEEKSAPYERLAATDTGGAVDGPHRRSYWTWVTISALIGGGLALLALVWRKRRARRTGLTSVAS
jgi:hypothetical protein